MEKGDKLQPEFFLGCRDHDMYCSCHFLELLPLREAWSKKFTVVLYSLHFPQEENILSILQSNNPLLENEWPILSVINSTNIDFRMSKFNLHDFCILIIHRIDLATTSHFLLWVLLPDIWSHFSSGKMHHGIIFILKSEDARKVGRG